MDFSETGIDPDDIPEPTIWRVLVFPKQPKRMTASGIALPSMAQSVERHLNYIGQVVAMGPIAGKSERFRRPDGTLAWDIKVGDWVIYGRYSGQHVEYQGVELLTVNDDDITMRIKNPAGFRVYL
ncbi:MAG: co-chaperone GroES [Burkholderiales bacterium]|nr:co-chaperone GroES [Burkholderiales bacterium]